MDEKMKKCPYCGEEILKKAIKCKYCEENIEEQTYVAGGNKTYLGFVIGIIIFVIAVIVAICAFTFSKVELFEVYKNDAGKYCFQYNYIENYFVNKMTSCHESKEEAEAYATCYKDSVGKLKEMAEEAEQGGLKNRASTMLENNVVTDFTVSQCLGVYQTPQQKTEQEAQDRAEDARQEAQQADEKPEQAKRDTEQARVTAFSREQQAIERRNQMEEDERQKIENAQQEAYEKENQARMVEMDNKIKAEQGQQPQYVHNTGNYSYQTASPQSQEQNVHKGNYSYTVLPASQ